MKSYILFFFTMSLVAFLIGEFIFKEPFSPILIILASLSTTIFYFLYTKKKGRRSKN